MATPFTLGFRRIERVRIVVGPSGATAEVTGISYRCPRSKRVSLRTAARLVTDGAPFTLEHVGRVAEPDPGATELVGAEQ
jgi:hypothetical protein